MTAMTREEAIDALADTVDSAQLWRDEHEVWDAVRAILTLAVDHLAAHPDVARVLGIGADREPAKGHEDDDHAGCERCCPACNHFEVYRPEDCPNPEHTEGYGQSKAGERA